MNKYHYKIKFLCCIKMFYSYFYFFYVPDQFELSKFSVSRIFDNSIFCLFRADSNYIEVPMYLYAKFKCVKPYILKYIRSMTWFAF